MAAREVKTWRDPPKPALEYLTEEIGRRFRVHHIEGDHHRIAFFTRQTTGGAPVRSDSTEVDRAFDELRVELKPYSFVPTLQLAGQDGIITVALVPDPSFRSTRVNWFLLVLTLLSVQWAGAELWASYISPHGPTGREPSISAFTSEPLAGGFLYFTLPLIAILGVHEMGHFFTARHYHVRASLPFFIPSVPPLGTFGAFISMRDPLPSRKVIFDVGLSGPLVGFCAAIVVTVAGVFLTQANPSLPRPEEGGAVILGAPLIFDWIINAIGVPASYLHPTLFAGWAGFLVTAFNLIPAAQLDGGHVLFSLLRNSPRREYRAMLFSFLAVGAIAVLGSLFGYLGWILLVFIVLITVRHPPPLNQISSLGLARLATGFIALLVFLISFTPAPIQLIPADLAFEVGGSPEPLPVPATGLANYTFWINNTGNAFNEIEIAVPIVQGPFKVGFGTNASSEKMTVLANKLEFENVSVNVSVLSTESSIGVGGDALLLLRPAGDPSHAKTLAFSMRTAPPHPAAEILADVPRPAQPGGLVQILLNVSNTGDTVLNLTLHVTSANGSWTWGFGGLGNTTHELDLLPKEGATVVFAVGIPGTAVQGQRETFTVRADDGRWAQASAEVSFEVVAGG